MPSSTDTEATDAPVVVDEARSALLEALQSELGDVLIESHLAPGVDLTVRIATSAWADTASYLRDRQRFRYFGFLSAIDWLPSPFGRSMDAVVDTQQASGATNEEEGDEMVSGLAGGDTRFQILARVFSLTTNLGVTLKCDVPDDDATVGSWVANYPGAEWHEREVWEMFGINFTGHPGLRPLYLPGDFEGNPLRKDFPLLARIIKPWPGIVDVEPMPEVETDDAAIDPAPAGDADVDPAPADNADVDPAPADDADVDPAPAKDSDVDTATAIDSDVAPADGEPSDEAQS